MVSSHKALKSAVMLVGNGLAQKLIGLISTLVLARVLLPDDFALVAIATLVIMFIEVFTITGSEQYILSQNSINRRILDSAWTLDIIVKSMASLVAFSLAYPVSLLYENPSLTPILLSLGIMPLLTGLSNPGLWRLKRQQRYSLVVSIQVTGKVVGVITTIAIALSTKSYWALIIGQLITTGSIFILSYAFCSYRPKLTLIHINKQYRFSSFMIGQELFGYLKSNIDTFFISKSYSNTEFGNFHVMKYIAVIPSLSIMVPLAEPLLVEMSKNNSKVDERLFKYTVSFIALVLVAFPISLLMLAHSEFMVSLLLGMNWIDYHQILGFMGLLVTSFVIANHCKRALIIDRKTNFVFIYEFFATLLVVISVVINLEESVIRLVKERVLIELLAVGVFLVVTSFLYLKANLVQFLLKIFPMMFGLATFSLFYLWLLGILQAALSSLPISTAVSILLFCFGYFVLLIIMFFGFYRRTREGIFIYSLIKKLFSSKRKLREDSN
jgi:lipopolysaccharide exporter